MDARLRAVCDLSVPAAREHAGLHEYDGRLQDLSADGVRAGLAKLGDGPPLDDPHDERHLAAFETLLRVSFEVIGDHRRNPLLHMDNLDLACYDREYAPAEERAAARRRHLAAWPDGIAMALEALDAVPAPVAQALLPAIRGLAAGIDADSGQVEAAAIAAHQQFVAHIATAAEHGHPDAALGADRLARLMGSAESLDVDLGRLAERADAERDRLRAMLAEACSTLYPQRSLPDAVAALVADHPDPDGVLTEARALTEETIAFTAQHRLVPHTDGECRVGPAPESRRWAMAMMSWAAPHEDDGPSWYHVTPPDSSWPAQDQEEWLAVFSRATLPAVTAHEVAPGHFTHGRSLRRAPTLVRRTLFSLAFVEGWAHYAEEMCLEEGLRADDPRFAAGVAIEALVRVTRLAVAIGLHSGTMTTEEAVQRFVSDAHLQGPAARSEAVRATFDPTYGRYTWGKLALMDLRERARATWGNEFSLLRFHSALMALGSPPLGLLDTALERG
ncbi:MAG: DUF885 domain-containing protein [Actinomycetota bacterium]|jgi:hypothetical protein|nr:DUF885 domain-containing protein [Actinomycetota bacterium]